MKIIVDKHEYAKIIRNCQSAVDSCSCTECALHGVCEGQESLENMVEVKGEESEFPIPQTVIQPFIQQIDGYFVRPCGGGWAYCDGNCTGCQNKNIYTDFITAHLSAYDKEDVK